MALVFSVVLLLAAAILILLFYLLKHTTSVKTSIIMVGLILAFPFHDVPYSGYLFEFLTDDDCGEKIYKRVTANGYLLGEERRAYMLELAPLLSGEYDHIETFGKISLNNTKYREEPTYFTHRVSSIGNPNCLLLTKSESHKAKRYGLGENQCITVSESRTPISKYSYINGEYSYIYAYKEYFRVEKVSSNITDIKTREVIAEFNKFNRLSWLMQNTSNYFGKMWSCTGKPNNSYDLPKKVIHRE